MHECKQSTATNSHILITQLYSDWVMAYQFPAIPPSYFEAIPDIIAFNSLLFQAHQDIFTC